MAFVLERADGERRNVGGYKLGAAPANAKQVKRHLGESGYDVSRMFMYFNARAITGARRSPTRARRSRT